VPGGESREIMNSNIFSVLENLPGHMLSEDLGINPIIAHQTRSSAFPILTSTKRAISPISTF
jgi:hypothetical protein